MHLSVNDIVSATKAGLSGNISADICISLLLTDSRKLVTPEQCCFFALKTKVRDGHNFINQLYQRGVRAFVVSNTFESNTLKCPEAVFFHVSSPLCALQMIAADYRKKFHYPVIGITGSNGKTVVKEWLYHLLSQSKTVVRSPKSYNSQTGVPLSVVLMDGQHEYAIFEAGISQPDEMQKLEEIIQPDFGIFTNIGPSHNENFKSTESKIKEKLLLFQNSDKVVACVNHEEIIQIAVKSKLLKKSNFFLWGNNNSCEVCVLDTSIDDNKTQFKVQYQNQTIEFEIPFADAASHENAMHCFSAMLMLGFDPSEVAEKMAALPSIAMRMELLNGINQCLIINDSYNSDLNSLSIALDFMKQQQQKRKSVVILSDILQSGIASEELYSLTAMMLSAKKADRFIGIGKDIMQHSQLFDNIPVKSFYSDTNHFLSEIKLSDFQDDILLIKGARDFSFESIVSLFQLKTHQTVLEINLNAIVHNLNYYKSLLRPKTNIMAMVKAFSYGAGSYEIAALLEYHHVNYLGVAYADEGVELRKKGIILPVMVMAPEEASAATIVTHNLEPEIYSFESLSWFESYGNETIKIHLKLDSGMHRLGFGEHELETLCEILKKMHHIHVVSVFSHLAVADDPAQTGFTKQQIKTFDRMSTIICKNLNISPLRHILNSAGTEAYPEAQYDMVRLGLGLYGIQPSLQKQLPLQQAARLKTRVIQTRYVSKGERIGYGNSYEAEKDMQIGLIPVGYADGFRRSLSNGKGLVYINDIGCKVVGNVCMDMSMIDITDMSVKVGDSVVVFDEEHSISELAQMMGVIPYEVITGISQRVKRSYLYE